MYKCFIPVPFFFSLKSLLATSPTTTKMSSSPPSERTCCLSRCVMQISAEKNQCLLCDFSYPRFPDFELDKTLLKHFSEKHASAELVSTKIKFKHIDPHCTPIVEIFSFIKSTALDPTYQKTCSHQYSD